MGDEGVWTEYQAHVSEAEAYKWNEKCVVIVLFSLTAGCSLSHEEVQLSFFLATW